MFRANNKREVPASWPSTKSATIYALIVLLFTPPLGHAYTSAEDFMRSYDINFSANDIVSGQAKIAKIDHELGLITLVHEAVVSKDGSLAMPEMSMALQVVNPHWLHEFRAGATVRFKAARRRGGITIIAIEPVEQKRREK